MRILLLLLSLAFISCREDSTAVTAPQSPVLETAPNLPEPSKISYVLTIYEVEEPTFEYSEAIRDINYNKITEAAGYAVYIPKVYCSNVQEFENFIEDAGYKALDDNQREVVTQSASYQADVQTHPISAENKAEMLQEFTKIKKRYYLAFNSYKEASEKRQALLYGNNP